MNLTAPPLASPLPPHATPGRSELVVPIRLVARETIERRGEPVSCGLPWPQGAVLSADQFRLEGPTGHLEAVQTRVLERWSDGSIRWCLFDFLASTDDSRGYRL